MCCPSALHLHAMAGRAIKFGNRRREREGAQQWRSHHRINVYSCICVLIRFVLFLHGKRDGMNIISSSTCSSQTRLFFKSHMGLTVYTHGKHECFFLETTRFVTSLSRCSSASTSSSLLCVISFCFFFRGNTHVPTHRYTIENNLDTFRFSRFFTVISSPIELLLLCFLFRSSAPDVLVCVSLRLLFGNKRE